MLRVIIQCIYFHTHIVTEPCYYIFKQAIPVLTMAEIVFVLVYLHVLS